MFNSDATNVNWFFLKKIQGMKHCFTNAEQKKINIIKDTFLDSWEKKCKLEN